MDAIGGKYKGMILYHLLDGPKRHSELRKLCAGVTQRMVTLQLRELQKAGLVNREVFPVVPQRVDYSLTELGLSLGPILRLMRDWGVSYMDHVNDDRDEIDTVVV
jgi:DNA-binding HxlR family transcriptional regulator